MITARTGKYFKLNPHIIAIIIITLILTQKPHRIKRYRKYNRWLSDLKHILIWTPNSGSPSEGQSYFIDHKCSYINCYITSNRSLLHDTRLFDAIVFNVQLMDKEGKDIPKTRSQMQKFIFASKSAPASYPVCHRNYDDFFNWTWTYRTDSTLPFKFISVYNNNDEEMTGRPWIYDMKPIDKSMKHELSSKHKAVAWFSDKCSSNSQREEFVRLLQLELSRYNLTVDIYGNCGPLKCRRKTFKVCYWTLKKFYFFYLALEDSISEDYVTDTVLHAVKGNAVPIVIGGADYQRILPPGSYIDANQQKPDVIAKTIYNSIRNPDQYHEFFSWKNYYSIREGPGADACQLCHELNNPETLTKTRHDVFMAARKHFGISNAWSSDGRIVVLLPNKTRQRIECWTELRPLMSKFPSKENPISADMGKASSAVEKPAAPGISTRRGTKAK